MLFMVDLRIDIRTKEMLNITPCKPTFTLIKMTIFSSNFFSDLKLGIFLKKLVKKDTFWRWEYNPITAIKSAKNKPWVPSDNVCIKS